MTNDSKHSGDPSGVDMSGETAADSAAASDESIFVAAETFGAPEPDEDAPGEATSDGSDDAEMDAALEAMTPPPAAALSENRAEGKADAKAKTAMREVRFPGALGVVVAGVFALAFGIVAYGLARSEGPGSAGFFLAAALAALSAIFVAATLIPSRAARRIPKTAELARKEVLSVLGLAENVLDADEEPRLLTRCDGAVLYANKAYVRLAGDAGAQSAAGLPPRVDRLFAQSGTEAAKIFRLCRAAKSGEAAEEVVTQLMGVDGAPALRRFEIALRPLDAVEDCISWRLRELGVEEAGELVAKAYDAYPRPVFGMERSGRIAWANAAFADMVGAEESLSGAMLSDIVLGETDELVTALWGEAKAPMSKKARRRGDDPIEASFAAFARGGVGDGFVCVDVMPDEPVGEEESEANAVAPLAGEVADAPFAVASIDGDPARDGKIVEANRLFSEMFSIKRKNTPITKCMPPELVRELSELYRRKSASKSSPPPIEARLEMTSEDGAPEERVFNLYLRMPKRRRGGYGARRAHLFGVDVTDRKRMETEHAQDTKLKAIGQLAGGVAHDFNNILQVVIGNCEMLLRRHAVGDPSYPDLIQMQQNAQRAANLTAKLLAFSRKQTLRAEPLAVTEVLREFTPFLTRSITEKVKLEIVNGRNLPPVRADRNQLEIALMNLAVNARDAMSGGGKVIIRTARATAEDIAAAGRRGLAETDHLMIEVADTGPGVPSDIVDRIFDPYFTTKELGKGTGLGLSTVHGIVGQMGGRIYLDNLVEDGKGAVFRIYLPADESDAVAPEETPAAEKTSAPASSGDLTGAGRILVVEDEDAVRAFVVRALQMCGYETEAACDGDEALEMVEEEPGAFDLILTDVMMPELDGPSFVAAAGDNLGAAKVIFMSGYAEGAMREKLSDFATAGYIQKPFSLKAVAALVKDVLSERREAA